MPREKLWNYATANYQTCKSAYHLALENHKKICEEIEDGLKLGKVERGMIAKLLSASITFDTSAQKLQKAIGLLILIHFENLAEQ